MEKIQTISCGCCVIKFINDVPFVLLVRPFANKDVWGIPKGHLDTNETFQNCAIRETLEETGINAQIIKLSEYEPLLPAFVSYRNEVKTVYAFIAIQSDPSEIPKCVDGENVDVSYWSLNSLPQIHVYQRNLLNELAEKISKMKRSLFNV